MDQSVVNRVYRQPGRATRAIVDLDAIAANFAAVRKLAGAETAIMAVVKANAYGHGAIAVARAALIAGATSLAVATFDEGAHLRRAGISAPILVLGPLDESEIPSAIDHELELAVGERWLAEAIAEAAARLASTSPVPIHLKVDTGMHRFGAAPEEAATIAAFVSANPSLCLRGVFTHFACADERDLQPTREQEHRFASVLRELADAGIHPTYIHSANSAATLRSETGGHNLVRLGIGLYGLSPSSDVPIATEMRAAMTIVSRITRVHALLSGDAVSYGATYRATTAERVALVPIGYADGYRRALSNRGEMQVRGRGCPVRGRVCMDQTVIGLPEGLHAAVGDFVIVAGGWSARSAPSLDRMAAWAETINYEIATGIGPRVPRWYVRDGAVVAVEDLAGYRDHPDDGLK